MIEPLNVKELERSLHCGGTPSWDAVTRVAEKLNEVIAALEASTQDAP